MDINISVGMAVIEEALPAPNWDICRHLQPNIGLSTVTTMKELGEGLKEPKGIAIS